MRVLTVVGARPQFIKAAVVNRVIRARSDLEEIIVHTGQHYDTRMSDVFFNELEIESPKHHLGIGSVSHGAQTGRMLEALESVIKAESPGVVLVYGDTNSTLAGALAAVKLHIPVAHVEAGLRSFNRAMPEEINRVLSDHVSDLLFAPTDAALANLRREGLPESRIHRVGDVMFDAAVRYAKVAKERSQINRELGLEPRKYALVTVHRAENTDDPQRLRAILDAIERIAREIIVVWPIHPRIRVALSQTWLGVTNFASKNLKLIEPVSYFDMVALEANAGVIATDSGGVQKEAYFYRVPCVTMRDETEWVELLAGGWNKLVNVLEPDVVVRTVLELILTPLPEYNATLYGDGRAGEAIVDALVGAFQGQR